MNKQLTSIKIFIIIFSLVVCSEAYKKCFTCRSRGDKGTCKDPFKFNVTMAKDEEIGIAALDCASGWCGKVLEGGTTYKDDDYGVATQRLCLQRGPSDDEERCAYTQWNHKKVYMCFCRGDLCNSAPRTTNVLYPLLLLSLSICWKM